VSPGYSSTSSRELRCTTLSETSKGVKLRSVPSARQELMSSRDLLHEPAPSSTSASGRVSPAISAARSRRIAVSVRAW
jgi:hypothetical protein